MFQKQTLSLYLEVRSKLVNFQNHVAMLERIQVTPITKPEDKITCF